MHWKVIYIFFWLIIMGIEIFNSASMGALKRALSYDAIEYTTHFYWKEACFISKIILNNEYVDPLCSSGPFFFSCSLYLGCSSPFPISSLEPSSSPFRCWSSPPRGAFPACSLIVLSIIQRSGSQLGGDGWASRHSVCKFPLHSSMIFMALPPSTRRGVFPSIAVLSSPENELPSLHRVGEGWSPSCSEWRRGPMSPPPSVSSPVFSSTFSPPSEVADAFTYDLLVLFCISESFTMDYFHNQ